MKTIRSHFTTLVLASCLVAVAVFFGASFPVQKTESHTPSVIFSTSTEPAITATAALVIDRQTGAALYEKNATTPLPIASVTKLFSSAQFYVTTDLQASTTIESSDVAGDGRSGRLQRGQTYQNRELIFPALLESSNDAAAAMDRVSGDELVASMNTYAKDHGAADTTFADTSGISDENISTARDIALLYEAVLEAVPHIIDITMLPQYLHHINAWQNNSPFIQMDGYMGGKHGYTNAANRTAVVRFLEETEAGEREMVYVLLGSNNLAADIGELRSLAKAAVSLE